MIHDHLEHFDITLMCDLLQVSRQGYYDWVDRPPSPSAIRRNAVIAAIRLSHTVARRMKEAGIRVKHRKAFVPRTTQCDPAHRTFGNVLDRGFNASLPNQKWAGDITYIPTLAGWVYLAVVIDLCSRKVVGWSMGDHLRTELAGEALALAIESRRPGAGLLHHSDRGVQYTSEDYQRLLSQNGIQPSMSGVGQCWDNAVAESFFATFKREEVNGQTYQSLSEARSSVFEWIECWYNRERLHSSLGYKSPEAFEAQFN
jgi:transposase InsO family protein